MVFHNKIFSMHSFVLNSTYSKFHKITTPTPSIHQFSPLARNAVHRINKNYPRNLGTSEIVAASADSVYVLINSSAHFVRSSLTCKYPLAPPSSSLLVPLWSLIVLKLYRDSLLLLLLLLNPPPVALLTNGRHFLVIRVVVV